jgi:hypothetical protein
MKVGFKAKIYPNGEFSLGYVADRRFEEKFEIDDNALRTGQAWWFHAPEFRRWTEERIAAGEKFGSDLGSSNPANYHKRRGLKGITSRGGRLVRNTAHMLQKKYGRRRLSFLTLTVPKLGESDELQICAQWSRVVRVLCQRLKRSLESAGLPANYVGVTEIQEKRFKERGEVGLHLHLVFVGRKSIGSDWAFPPSHFRQQWLDVLSHVVGHRLESSSCENVKGVRKSASGYLGKYMSKGVGIVSEVIESKGEEYVPTAWYTCSMGLKHAYAQAIASCWDEDLGIVMRLPLLCESGAVRSVGITCIEINGRSVLVGINGKFDRWKSYRYIPGLREIFDQVDMWIKSERV